MYDKCTLVSCDLTLSPSRMVAHSFFSCLLLMDCAMLTPLGAEEYNKLIITTIWCKMNTAASLHRRWSWVAQNILPYNPQWLTDVSMFCTTTRLRFLLAVCTYHVSYTQTLTFGYHQFWWPSWPHPHCTPHHALHPINTLTHTHMYIH